MFNTPDEIYQDSLFQQIKIPLRCVQRTSLREKMCSFIALTWQIQFWIPSESSQSSAS